jgi:ABC-type xylose transport system permease subunit
MGFPLSATGSIRVDTTDVPRAIQTVDRLLRNTKASTIAIHENRIDFTVHFFRLVTNWNLLVLIDSGSIVFRERDHAIDVEYDISFRRWFFIVTGIVAVVLVLVLLFAIDPRSGVSVPFLILLWLFLLGSNYFIAALRFPAALRSSLGFLQSLNHATRSNRA